MSLKIDSACLESLDFIIEHCMLSEKNRAELCKDLMNGVQLGTRSWLKIYFQNLLDCDSEGEVATSQPDRAVNRDLTHAGHDRQSSVQKAEKSFRDGRLQDAYQHAKMSYSVDPYDARSLLVYVACLVQLALSTELFYLGHELVHSFPKVSSSWYAVGYKRNAKYWVMLGHVFSSQQESEQAIAAYRTAVQLLPGDCLPMVFMAKELLRTNHSALALQILLASLSNSSHDHLLFNEIGVAHCMLNNHSDALKYLTQAINKIYGSTQLSQNIFYNQINHCDIEIISNFATSLRKNRQYVEALLWFEKCLVLAPLDVTCHVDIGFTLHLMRRFDDSITTYHRALALQPSNSLCLELLNLCSLSLSVLNGSSTSRYWTDSGRIYSQAEGGEQHIPSVLEVWSSSSAGHSNDVLVGLAFPSADGIIDIISMQNNDHSYSPSVKIGTIGFYSVFGIDLVQVESMLQNALDIHLKSFLSLPGINSSDDISSVQQILEIGVSTVTSDVDATPPPEEEEEEETASSTARTLTDLMEEEEEDEEEEEEEFVEDGIQEQPLQVFDADDCPPLSSDDRGSSEEEGAPFDVEDFEVVTDCIVRCSFASDVTVFCELSQSFHRCLEDSSGDRSVMTSCALRPLSRDGEHVFTISSKLNKARFAEMMADVDEGEECTSFLVCRHDESVDHKLLPGSLASLGDRHAIDIIKFDVCPSITTNESISVGLESNVHLDSLDLSGLVSRGSHEFRVFRELSLSVCVFLRQKDFECDFTAKSAVEDSLPIEDIFVGRVVVDLSWLGSGKSVCGWYSIVDSCQRVVGQVKANVDDMSSGLEVGRIVDSGGRHADDLETNSSTCMVDTHREQLDQLVHAHREQLESVVSADRELLEKLTAAHSEQVTSLAADLEEEEDAVISADISQTGASCDGPELIEDDVVSREFSVAANSEAVAARIDPSADVIEISHGPEDEDDDEEVVVEDEDEGFERLDVGADVSNQSEDVSSSDESDDLAEILMVTETMPDQQVSAIDGVRTPHSLLRLSVEQLVTNVGFDDFTTYRKATGKTRSELTREFERLMTLPMQTAIIGRTEESNVVIHNPERSSSTSAGIPQ
eukprot:gene21622-27661_t